jgi:hypothetical protein
MAQCIYRHMPNLYQWIERLALNTLVPIVFIHAQLEFSRRSCRKHRDTSSPKHGIRHARI